MVPETETPTKPLPGVKRVLGHIRGPRPGPTLICIGGLHGNEPAGILALERVLGALEGRAGELSGDIVALAGNRAALAQRRRYLSRDLNRSWTPEGVRAAREASAQRHREEPLGRSAGSEAHSPGAHSTGLSEGAQGRGEAPESQSEDGEQLELLAALEEAIGQARGSVFVLDLHTTSGPGDPFCTVMDSLASRRFARGFPVPLIVGLGELLEGTLLEYLADRGIPGMVYEGGQHESADAVGISVAGIWLALALAGVILESAFPEVSVAREHLRGRTRDLPRTLELRYRHPVAAGDGFESLPGLRSFQRVVEGEVLARDRNGDVRSPEGGRLLMPLYQAQGEDGFFLIREFHPFWLSLSEALRRMRADRIIHWLPGIRRDPQEDRGLIVDRRWARWSSLEFLHLLGYRKRAEEGDLIHVLLQKE